MAAFPGGLFNNNIYCCSTTKLDGGPPVTKACHWRDEISFINFVGKRNKWAKGSTLLLPPRMTNVGSFQGTYEVTYFWPKSTLYIFIKNHMGCRCCLGMVAKAQLLKKSAWPLLLIGGKAPPAARDSNEVARAWICRCHPHTGNGGHSWCLSSSQ